jgi:probable DNA repair protein
MPGAIIEKNELFARLAAGHGARFTVVTPNRRLAQALASEFESLQVAQGRAVWEAADIVPFPAFVARAYEDWLYSEADADVPVLLSGAEEQALWEDAVRRSEAGGALLAVPETGRLAREAWRIAHAWRLCDALERAGPDEDAAAFRDWAEHVKRATARSRSTDSARLPDLVAGALAQPTVRKPACLVRYGFDLVTPQQESFFAALDAQGVKLVDCLPRRGAGRALRLACADARDEIQRAARWARARLQANPAARIGVIVPDLAKHRDAVRRAFAQTMAPGASDPRVGERVLPVNISLGEPLTAAPLVAHALLVLELLGREIEFERASRILRSPFIAAGEAERESRARLDALLRRRAEPVLTLDRLAGLARRDDLPRCPVLAQRLAALTDFRKARLFGAHGPRVWSEAFHDALRLAGFPGERTLDSDEYQTLAKWHETLAQFARVERVAERMGFGAALARVTRIAGETLFQPETPAVPVQVLGVLEAAGLEFDHLWVMGLSHDAWPMRPSANPFIPIRAQREAGVPNASPATTLDLARRRSAEWRSCAGEVVLSHPLRENDRMLAASAVIAHVPEGETGDPAYESWRAEIRRARRVERAPDCVAPPLAYEAVAGGVAVLRDQAACPFRAAATHRLGAQALAPPHAGLDALERGTLVHRVLAYAWHELKTKHALDATPGPALEALLAGAAEEAIAWQRRDRPSTLAGRFAAVERTRLAGLARAWLDYEKRRGDFTVLAVEDKRSLALGRLGLNVRLDRVDETAAGERIVVDYKTAKSSLTSLLGERPDEPQLPLYACVAEPAAAAAAFAQVRAGNMKFVGMARHKDLLDGAQAVEAAAKSGAEPSWDEQVAFWRAALDRLARDFANGVATVDPKRGLPTCRGCEGRPFCRIYERIGSTLAGGAE